MADGQIRMNERTTLPITGYPKSMLTTRQQGELRGKLMHTASKVATQLDGYVENNQVQLQTGELVNMSPARLQAYRLILERTIPTLSATEIRHKSSLESLGTDALVTRLAALVQQRPELQAKLMEALGPKVIEASAVTREGERVAGEKAEQAAVTLDAECTADCRT